MKGNGTWELRNHNEAAEVVKCGFLDSYAWNPKIQLDDQCLGECPGRYLGIIGQNPSVFKSNRAYVVVFQLFSL